MMRRDGPTGRNRVLLGLLGGACVVLGFPPFTFFPPLLIAGPALLLHALHGAGMKRALLVGLAFGGVVQAGGFPWLAGTVTRFYGIVPGPSHAPSDAAAFWLGIGAFAVWWIGSTLAWVLFALGVVRGPRGGTFDWLWPPLLWSAIEAWYPRVFPWSLGAGFSGWDWTAQAAWFVGVEGLSVISVLTGALCVHGLRLRRSGFANRRPLIAAGAIAFVLLALGAVRHSTDPAGETDPLRLGYVQACVPLESRHSRDARVVRAVLDEVVGGTRALAEAEPVDIVVWSEGMIPGITREAAFREWVVNDVQTPIAIGGLRSELGDERIWNRLFVSLDAEAVEVRGYDKMDLVPFGEVFPLRGVLTSLGVPIPESPIAMGEGRVAIPIAGVPVGPSVCFEGILPGTAPGLRRAGARLHLNVTEDLWYGDSGAPRQHLALTRMRAIESGLPLVRITNGGISVATDARGRVLERVALGERRSGVFALEVPRELESRPWTALAAPWLPWIAILIVVFWVGRRFATRGARPGRIPEQ